jgi:hypothetical protein
MTRAGRNPKPQDVASPGIKSPGNTTAMSASATAIAMDRDVVVVMGTSRIRLKPRRSGQRRALRRDSPGYLDRCPGSPDLNAYHVDRHAAQAGAQNVSFCAPHIDAGRFWGWTPALWLPTHRVSHVNAGMPSGMDPARLRSRRNAPKCRCAAPILRQTMALTSAPNRVT